MKKNKHNKWFIIMFILIIMASILLRINSNITKIIGLIIFPFVILSGIIIIHIEK